MWTHVSCLDGRRVVVVLSTERHRSSASSSHTGVDHVPEVVRLVQHLLMVSEGERLGEEELLHHDVQLLQSPE